MKKIKTKIFGVGALLILLTVTLSTPSCQDKNKPIDTTENGINDAGSNTNTSNDNRVSNASMGVASDSSRYSDTSRNSSMH